MAHLIELAWVREIAALSALIPGALTWAYAVARVGVVVTCAAWGVEVSLWELTVFKGQKPRLVDAVLTSYRHHIDVNVENLEARCGGKTTPAGTTRGLMWKRLGFEIRSSGFQPGAGVVGHYEPDVSG